jgi:hypothetical protein
MKHGWNTRRLYFVNLELEMLPVTFRDCQLSSHLTVLNLQLAYLVLNYKYMK